MKKPQKILKKILKKYQKTVDLMGQLMHNVCMMNDTEQAVSDIDMQQQEFKMDRTYIKKLIKNHMAGSTVGVNKAGNIVVRRGFYYTRGKTHDDLAKTVNTVLTYYRSTATIVDKGTVWKPFRGGATTANSSHWFVEVAVQ